MRILDYNLLNSETVYTVSSEEISAPASNLLDDRLSRFLFFTGKTDEWVKIDAGVGNTFDISAVGIAGHNLTDSATVKVQGNNTDSWGTPSFDETLTIAEVMVYFSSTQTYRYFRIQFSDATNPINIYVGKIYFGEYLQMPPADLSINIIHNYVSIKNDSDSGQRRGKKKYKYRTLSFSLPIASADDKNTVIELIDILYDIEHVFLVVWENSLDIEGAMYCVFDSDKVPTTKLRDVGILYDIPLLFREVR